MNPYSALWWLTKAIRFRKLTNMMSWSEAISFFLFPSILQASMAPFFSSFWYWYSNSHPMILLHCFKAGQVCCLLRWCCYADNTFQSRGTSRLRHFHDGWLIGRRSREQYQHLHRRILTLEMLRTHGQKSLLTSTIPNLKPTYESINFFVNIFEIDSDGRVCLELKLVINKSV